jgi:hypothetical protein
MVSRGAHAGGSGRQRVARWELRGRLALTCTVGAQIKFTAALESVDILGAPRTAQPQGLFSLRHHFWTDGAKCPRPVSERHEHRLQVRVSFNDFLNSRTLSPSLKIFIGGVELSTGSSFFQ